MERRKLVQIFDRQASRYERMRKKGILASWRRRLLADARGEVLEVAVGAGANFAYYPLGVKKVTGVDFSPAMLEKAKEAASEVDLKVELLEADVEALTYPENSFDTIVSTLSLCGYEDPGRVLRSFASWCRPEGKILLLEHGLSSKKPVARLQEWIDPLNYRWVGCHQNRDILRLVNRQLKVERVERRWLGMVSLIRAHPVKTVAGGENAGNADEYTEEGSGK
ncbi:methyltransferase family protein [Melghirimyces profundicolus]|uniref:Methyltransferase family protein n=1 Tax=Melghirimyces profundicolus TaxID=1242148 RepID=A0A2T6C4F1_9BACL|nr:class I SAM-dependent methyltransferase [Melghirimyces profundicolus]PTX63206.1 methyltransferase family protein [Melghirimyces profundicolus]